MGNDAERLRQIAKDFENGTAEQWLTVYITDLLRIADRLEKLEELEYETKYPDI